MNERSFLLVVVYLVVFIFRDEGKVNNEYETVYTLLGWMEKKVVK